MVEAIDSGLQKFSSTNPNGDVELDNYLDDIEKEISKVLKLKENRPAKIENLAFEAGIRNTPEKPR